MRTLNVFNFITLNGFHKGLNEDISWYPHGSEASKFSEEGANSGSTLLFGRVTYQMMEKFWPTPMAKKSMPVVADGMNKAEKIVFSKTLKKLPGIIQSIQWRPYYRSKKLKKLPGKGITILGSGSIVSQLADHHLIDEYQCMLDPVAFGEGTPVFKGIKHKLELTLIGTRTFKNGIILLNYKAIK